MTVTLLVQKVAYIYAVRLKRERFLYLLSVLRNMSLESEKNFEKFCALFCPKTPSMKKILTSFLGQNVAYKRLVQFTNPWTLYSDSVLRYRGTNTKIFRKTFFGENVAQDPATFSENMVSVSVLGF